MGPRDLRSVTWRSDEVFLRTWDHVPVVVKIEEEDLRLKKGVKADAWLTGRYISFVNTTSRCLGWERSLRSRRGMD